MHLLGIFSHCPKYYNHSYSTRNSTLSLFIVNNNCNKTQLYHNANRKKVSTLTTGIIQAIGYLKGDDSLRKIHYSDKSLTKILKGQCWYRTISTSVWRLLVVEFLYISCIQKQQAPSESRTCLYQYGSSNKYQNIFL